MNLIEPQWGHHILITLNTIVFNSPQLTKIIPILADVFVFAYPLLLIIWYGWGIYRRDNTQKSDALTVFFGAVYAIAINLLIQFFIHKDRPIFSGDNSIHLILKELPTAAFPSDHAAVSMAMGIGTLLIGHKQNNIILKAIGYLLIGIAGVMSISRVAVGVHRPTDILAGRTVACVIVYLLQKTIWYTRQQHHINYYIISVQNWLLSKTGIKQ